jgi:hypothetical protein
VKPLELDETPELEVEPIKTRRFDARVPREWTRVALAAMLALSVLVFAGTILWRGLNMVQSLDDLAKLAGLVFSPLFGVVGTVLGFYFGSRERD